MKVPVRTQKPFGIRFPAFHQRKDQASGRRKNEGWVANGAERLRMRLWEVFRHCMRL
jgi:hypothetical protein